MRSLVALLAVSVLVGLSPAAGAQSNPFGPLPPTPQEPPPAPAPVTRDDDGDGLAKWQQVLILVAAVAVLGGIAWAIVRDAHRAAPVDAKPRPTDERPPSARERERRQQRARERAKAARRQRKRNRAR